MPGRGRRWLAERHPKWKGLRSLEAITERRIDQKSGKESLETRFFVASIEPDPNVILHAGRSHWGIKNNLHLTLDVIFDEDRCKTRKDNAPLSLAIIRHTALNILKADRSNGSLRRKPSGPGCRLTRLPRVRIDWTANAAMSAVIPTPTQASSAVTS